MDIYENIVIGNFLFQLGVRMGVRVANEYPPMIVNLLQQTPLDREVGDVLIKNACVMRLLEFKRERNDSDKEESKLEKLEASLDALPNSGLKELSRKVHWFVASEKINEDLITRIVPYLDLRQKSLRGPSLLSFIDSIVDDVKTSTADQTETFKRYLKLVSTSQGSPVGASGGLIVTIKSNGEITYFVLEDLRELSMTLQNVHNLYVVRQMVLEKLTEQEPSHGRGRSIEREIEL